MKQQTILKHLLMSIVALTGLAFGSQTTVSANTTALMAADAKVTVQKGLQVSHRDINKAEDQLENDPSIKSDDGNELLLFDENNYYDNALIDSPDNQDDQLQIYVGKNVPAAAVTKAINFWNQAAGSQIVKTVNREEDADIYIGDQLGRLAPAKSSDKTVDLGVTYLDGDENGMPFYHGFYNIIELNTTFLNALKKYDHIDEYPAVIAHEIGHALGLGHVVSTRAADQHQIMTTVDDGDEAQYHMNQATIKALQVAMLGWPISVQMAHPNSRIIGQI